MVWKRYCFRYCCLRTMSSNVRSRDASRFITTCLKVPCELLLPACVLFADSYLFASCSLLVCCIMENDYRYLFAFIILLTTGLLYHGERLSIPFCLHHLAHYWFVVSWRTTIDTFLPSSSCSLLVCCIMENDYRYLFAFIILLTTGLLYHGERLSILFKSRIFR